MIMPKTDLASTISLMHDGQGLDGAEAQALEACLTDDPRDIESRIKLIGYHITQAEKLNANRLFDHLSWLVANHPNETILGMSDLVDFNFPQLASCWRTTLHDSTEPDVFGNAALYFRECNPSYSVRLLARAQRLDPKNPKWLCERARMYCQICGTSRRDERGLVARKAIELGRQALDLYLNKKADCSFLDQFAVMFVTDLVEAGMRFSALHDAETLAKELFRLSPTVHSSVNREGSKTTIVFNGNAEHVAHGLLGRIALIRGDIPAARSELRLMCSQQVSGTWDLSLAQAMLDIDELGAVSQFLHECISGIDACLHRTKIGSQSRAQEIFDKRLQNQKLELTNALSQLSQGHKPILLS